jgi:hypothetical protein
MNPFIHQSINPGLGQSLREILGAIFYSWPLRFCLSKPVQIRGIHEFIVRH